jgi:lipooligosaccharide transport system ATP-binding protein
VGTQDRGVDRVGDLASRVEELPDRVLLYTDDADRTAVEVTERGVVPESTVSRRATLEDVFLRLTGRRLID